MSAFVRAFNATFDSEGGYVWENDPQDPGGETYAGISRRWHNEWSGWRILDQIKSENILRRGQLVVRDDLTNLVQSFYKGDIWDRLRGDDVARIDADVAVELFDCAFHHGSPRGVMILQEGLSLLNRDQRLFADLALDGVIGGKTFAALQRIKQANDIDDLIKAMRLVRGAFIIDILRRYPERERFARGWFDRIIINAAKRGKDQIPPS